MHQFLILGGDSRQICLNRLLSQSGARTLFYYDRPSSPFSLREAMEDSHIILCPVPFTKDGKTIFSENSLPGLDIQALADCLKNTHILFGGNIPSSVRERCDSLSIPCHDFMRMEEVAWRNAVATAEGAVAEAIALSPVNLYRSRCLVTGYGRCASILADRLKGMGAGVTVAGRDAYRLVQAHCLGYDTCLLKELESVIGEFDFIFNTIPSLVLDGALAKQLQENASVIDIASAPGGVDFQALKRRNIRARLCPGLPGRYSPHSSAIILYEAVMEHIRDSQTQQEIRRTIWN